MGGREVPCYLCGEDVVVGEDYQSHVQIVHDVEYDETKIFGKENINTKNKIDQTSSIEGHMEESNKLDDSTCMQDIFDKLREIKDMVEGNIEMEDSSEDDEFDVLDEEQIDQMFESIKSKVIIMDLSKNNPKNADASVDATRKWYDGTYFNCLFCHKTIYGEEYFRKHLEVHTEYPKTLQEVKKCSTDYEEALYTCQVCSRKLKHEKTNIVCHVQTHCKTLQEYEARYVDIKGELQNLPVIKDASKKLPEEKLLISNGDVKEETRQSRNPPRMTQDSPELSSEDNPPSSPSFSEKPSLLVRQDIFSDSISQIKNKKEQRVAPLKPDHFQPKVPLSETNYGVKDSKLSGIDVLKVSKHAKKVKPISMYHCPIIECKFITTKEGMKNSEAAIHLKNEHGIKAADMKPGMYKFEKIKKIDQ